MSKDDEHEELTPVDTPRALSTLSFSLAGLIAEDIARWASTQAGIALPEVPDEVVKRVETRVTAIVIRALQPERALVDRLREDLKSVLEERDELRKELFDLKNRIR